MNLFKMGILLACGPVVLGAVMATAPSARAQTAIPAYTLTAFPGTPPAGATKPDDLAISANGARLWVGYGNGVDTTGKGGPSNVVEYDIASGEVLKSISIPGHVDGLKIIPPPEMSGQPRTRTVIQRWRSSITRVAISRSIGSTRL